MWFIVITGVFGAVGYGLGWYHYDNPSDAKAMTDLRKAISNAKRENKSAGVKYKADGKKLSGGASVLEKQIGEALLKSYDN